MRRIDDNRLGFGIDCSFPGHRVWLELLISGGKFIDAAVIIDIYSDIRKNRVKRMTSSPALRMVFSTDINRGRQPRRSLRYRRRPRLSPVSLD